MSEKLPKEEYDPKTYKAEQIQRYNERQIRYWKKRSDTVQAGSLDNSKERAKVAYWQARQREHLKQTGLTRLPEREKVYNKSGIVKVNTSGIASKANKLYNTGSEAENIKAYNRDKPIRDKIQSTDTVKTIDPGKFRNHVPGTLEYDQYAEKLTKAGQYGPSRLTITDNEAQTLINKHHGTGILGKRKDGSWNNTEIITIHPDDIGFAVNNCTGVEAKTSVFKIHYGNKGTHIVPDYPSKKGAKATK